MKKKKIAGITIGQSPRFDISDDIRLYLSESIELVEYGALDPYAIDEVIDQFSPKRKSDILVTRMQDGTQVRLDGSQVSELVQRCIFRAETDGVDGIILLCTGTFDHLIHTVPLIIPQPIFHAVVSHVANGQKVGVIIPESDQIMQAKQWWQDSGLEIEIVSASPYQDTGPLTYAALELKSKGISLICLDCMGYNTEMKQLVAEVTSLPVILPRSLIARLADEMFGG